jgi:hypothetical protein
LRDLYPVRILLLMIYSLVMFLLFALIVIRSYSLTPYSMNLRMRLLLIPMWFWKSLKLYAMFFLLIFILNFEVRVLLGVQKFKCERIWSVHFDAPYFTLIREKAISLMLKSKSNLECRRVKLLVSVRGLIK